MLSQIILAASIFAACAVEAVEALTIVLAVGITRGWRSTLYGVTTALLTLAIIIAVLGPALVYIPIATLRLVVGTLLLIFGLQWIRKAILRSIGYLRLHDEAAIFEKAAAAAKQSGPDHRRRRRIDDWYSFTVAYKGVLLEGLEVAFIVLAVMTSGAAPWLSIGSAVAAILVITGLGIWLKAPLTQIPENTLKYGVGIMLTSFGTFWAGEGVGLGWPGSDAAIPVLILAYLLASLALTAVARRLYAPRVAA